MTIRELPHHNIDPPPLEDYRPVRVWLRRGVLAIAFLVLLIFGAATVAGFNGRESWRCELLCHFRVQYFWVLVATATALLWLHRWFLFAVAAVGALVNLAVILPLYFGPDDVPAVGKPIRVLSLNVHFINRNHLATLELIRREKPDLIYLMEITPVWGVGLESLRLDYPHVELLPSSRPDGVALFSRHPIENIEVRRDPGIGLPTLIARIKTPRGRMTLVATHPSSPGSPTSFEARNVQLAQVADWAAEQSGPVMLVGDLNTTSWSPFFADLLAASGLRDSRLGFGVEPTWPWFPLPLRIPIDHCLVSPQISIVDRRVGSAVGSDHRPILVDFTY